MVYKEYTKKINNKTAIKRRNGLWVFMYTLITQTTLKISKQAWMYEYFSN